MAKRNKSTKTPEEISPANSDLYDSDEDSTLVKWLRSGDGVEFMKLFVMGNTLIVFLMMSWPSLKESINYLYYMYKTMGFIFIYVMSWYTLSVWKLIDVHFNEEFKKYLSREFKLNKFTHPHYTRKEVVRNQLQTTHIVKTHLSEQIGSKQLICLFIITGFVLCGVVEQSASVALRANSTSSYSAAEFAEYVENTSYITRYCQPPDKNETSVVRSIPHIEIPMTRTDKTESVLREAFMWGTLISPLAASRVAARVGAERLFGAGVLGAGISAVMVPASWLTPYHVAIRIVQGIFMGATWPAAHMLAVTWFKPKNLSAFVSTYTAVNLGYAVVGLLGTPLVRKLGRDWLSYVITLSTCVWYFLWWRFVEETLNPNRPIRDEHRLLPWRRLLLSKPAWACGIAVVGSQWADATLMLGVTKYLKLVYGFSIAYEDVLASLPHIGHFFAAITFGIVVDHVRESQIVSTTTARKLFVYISHFLPAALLFVLGYTGCDPAAPAALYTAALALTGATPAGAFASAADIAPNFAGTVFGLCQTIGAAGLLAANYVVSEGLHGSFAGWWRLVFGVSSAVLLTTATFFMAIGSGSIQDWNAPCDFEMEREQVEEPSRLESVLE